MRRLIFQVSLGEVPPFYHCCTKSAERYADRIGADYKKLTEPVLRIAPKKSCRSANAMRLGFLPILEKSAAFGYLDEYDQVAVIDADIYVRPSAPNLFDELSSDFAGVLERDAPNTQKHADKVRKYSEGQYGKLTDVDWQWNESGAAFYNMGLMLFGRSIAKYLGGTPEQFIRRPEFERFVNGEGHWRWSTDQTLLNYWVKKSGMTVQNLSWKWNALYGAVRDVSQAHFVHFFLADKMDRGGAEIPSIIERL